MTELYHKPATTWRCSCKVRTLEDALIDGEPTPPEIVCEARYHIARALFWVRDLPATMRHELTTPEHPCEPVSAVLAEVARQVNARTGGRP